MFIIEVLHHTEPRIRTPEAEKASEVEIENLVRRGTWEMVLEEDDPKSANVITGSFVVTVKDVEIENPIFKPSFVAHGNRDAEKDQLVYDSTTARQSSARLQVALGGIWDLTFGPKTYRKLTCNLPARSFEKPTRSQIDN